MNTSEKVKHIMDLFDLSLDEVAKYLGITTQSLRNKLNRDSFSIKDLVIISNMCDAELNIKFIVRDEIEPIIFDYDILSKEEVQRLENLDQEKANKFIEHLSSFLPKLSSKDQEKLMNDIQFLQEHMKK